MGDKAQALLILNFGARWGWVVSTTPRPLYPRGNTRYPLYRRLGGPRGRSGRVRKSTQPAGFRTPDRPARSESLRRVIPAASDLLKSILILSSYLLRLGLRGYLSSLDSLTDIFILVHPHAALFTPNSNSQVLSV